MRCPVFKSCMRSPALIAQYSALPVSVAEPHLLLCTSFSDTSRDYVCYNITRLDPCKEQLAYLAKAADWVEIRFTKRTHP